MNEMSWVGSQTHFVDELDVKRIGHHVVLGRFGGNSSEGAWKNEDGCLVWTNETDDWEFVVLLDAHNTAESAELVIKSIESQRTSIINLLMMDVNQAFDEIQALILSVFKSENFKRACREIKGETACLIVIRKGAFLFWFSIGDCLLLLNHPDFAAFGEYQQNHRSFFEWVGQESTFNKTVPCYSSGRKELRKGKTHIFLTTDGLVECPNTAFNNHVEIFKFFKGTSNQEGVADLLEMIKNNNVRDSTTIITWKVTLTHDPTMPSDLK
jgi:serine/threonine protein phosphatase PrpC